MKRQPRHRNPYVRLGLTSKASPKDVERAHRELVEFLTGAPEGLRRWARDEITAVDEAHATLSNPGRAGKARRSAPGRRILVGIATLAVTVGVVVGIYNIGGGSSEGQSPEGGTAGAPALSPGDEFRVSKLMKKLKTKPDDVATLVELGNIFFEAQAFNDAGGWMKRALAIEPDNVKARLALGASEFNIGDVADARRDWRRVIAADPENVEAYYDLGFLFVSQDPPNMTEAKAMWGKVVELAPDSAVAKTVSTHLEGLEKSEEAGSETTSSAGSEG